MTLNEFLLLPTLD